MHLSPTSKIGYLPFKMPSQPCGDTIANKATQSVHSQLRLLTHAAMQMVKSYAVVIAFSKTGRKCTVHSKRSKPGTL